jgi:4-diphosphocytidyl-2-C-methyl-D-erythritol kinase
MTFAVRAPAKVNLHLRVVGRRSDGYHEVRTLLQTIDLFDDLRGSGARPGHLELRVEPAGCVSCGADNLVMRAADALRRHSGIEAGARLELRKRIPVGAGLGGGSSDAAATLVLLNELWGLGLDRSVLAGLAAGLGSDVSFFLTAGLALATGRGEIIHPLPDLADYGVVVCAPPIEIATAEVYALFAARPLLTSRPSDATVDAFAARGEEAAIGEPPWSDLENDLEPVVVESWPEVGRSLAALKATRPLHAAVTGSGSAVYAVYSDLEAARKAATDVGGTWDVRVASTVGRSNGQPVVE